MNKINLIKKIASLTLIGSLVVLPTTLINTSCTNKTNPADYLSTLRLKTTPILKQYNATIVQNFNILENSRIIVDTNSSGDLSNLCNLISQRYYDAEFSFTKLPIISGTELDAQNGDFYLIAKPNAVSESTNVEAYKIVIDSSIKIYANSEQASYYAFNTLLQLRKSNNNNINYGTIIDWPDLSERTVHLDCGRKYFSPEWIKNFILQISYEKINTLQLHFSEISCFRFQLPTDTYPQYATLAGARADFDQRFLTANEMTDIVNFAHQHYVDIIPSLDSPGHSRWIIEWYHANNPDKDISLYNNDGVIDFVTAINITNSDAQTFLKNLYEAICTFFKNLGCSKFDMGFDEFVTYSTIDSTALTGYTNTFKAYADANASIYGSTPPVEANRKGADVLVWWFNELASIIRNKGFTVRAYNDQVENHDLNVTNIETDKSVEIMYWTNASGVSDYATAKELAQKGYKLINLNDDELYYVVGANMPKPQGFDVYDNYNIYKFSQNPELSEQYRSSVVSAYYCVWCDYYTRETEETIWKGSFKSIMSFSERTWNINKQCSYDIYKQNVLNILLDPQSTFDSPLYGPNDGYIVGPSEITTSTDIYRSGSNAEFWLDDIPYQWIRDPRTVLWYITKISPQIYAGTSIEITRTGTYFDNMLLRFPSYDSIVSGKYFVNVRCDALMQNNENKSFEKTIWLYY